jgi:AbrB family looped-hinge helix DNA binding protein
MPIVRVSSRFQILIPKAIRNKLNIKAGQKLSVSEANGTIVITPIPSDPVDFLYGILKDEPSLTEELLKERARDQISDPS